MFGLDLKWVDVVLIDRDAPLTGTHEHGLWVKVGPFGRRKKPCAACGWASTGATFTQVSFHQAGVWSGRCHAPT